MTFTQFASLIRFYTRTNSTTFADSDILLLANLFKDEQAAAIAKECGEDFFGLRLDRNLVAGQREYDLPANVMGKIKYLEAKLDGTNWKKLTETDLLTYHKAVDETTIRETYVDKDPEYDIWDNSIYLLSGTAIIDVPYGLKLWAIIFPADFVSLASTEDMSNNPSDYSHGFPRQFHELLARRISIAYKSTKDKPIPLSEKEQTYEVDFSRTLMELKDLNLDRTTAPKAPYYDGSNN